MKILGVIIYLMGFLGIAFIITETNIDLGDSFISILLMFGWLLLTMGIGTALMNSGDDSNKKE
ncbi:MAG: hypothetical protein J6K51_04155 [Clostridia bacterium]|nr:hypothetical protein [Clostridia bacterium]